MAEVLGVVGSVIGIAQLAGNIITTGIELRGVLKDMRDIPDDVLFRLDQLHMLSSTLQQSGGAGIRADAGLTYFLKDNARQQCQACLSSLTHILEDLSSRIQRSSGTRRKVVLARQILRKDELAKIERRLASAVELLKIANQIYIIDILESQRRDISHLLSNKSATVDQRAIRQTSNSGLNDSTPDSFVGSEQGIKDVSLLSAASINRAFRLSSGSEQPDIEWSWEIGIACITGTLGVKTYQSEAADQASMKPLEENRDENKHVEPLYAAPKASIKITFPRWWSTQVIDCLFYRTQVGWFHLLRTRNTLQKAGSLRYDVRREINMGDLTALRKRFDQKQLAPWDELGNGWDLFSLALNWGQLRVCSYLLDCGVEPYAKIKLGYKTMPAFILDFPIEDLTDPSHFLFTVQDDRNLDYQRLVGQIDQNDCLADVLLSYCKGGPETFTILRRSVWLDEEYYSEAFLRRRMSLATNMATLGSWTASPDDDIVGMIRVALDQQGVLKRAALDLTVASNKGTLLHGLASAIGLLEGHRSISQWLDLIAEVLQELPRTQQLCQVSFLRSQEPWLETPLSSLIARSFVPSPPMFYSMQPPSSSDWWIARCERSIYLWLQSLYDCGVDLLEYGREEAKRHADYPGQAASFGIQRAFLIMLEWTGEVMNSSSSFVRLINFQIGQLPSQWKFWWSEPTDEFAGDFWDLITEQEITGLRVPGAWAEDE